MHLPWWPNGETRESDIYVVYVIQTRLACCAFQAIFSTFVFFTDDIRDQSWSETYHVTQVPVWTQNVHPSLRFQQQLYSACPLNLPRLVWGSNKQYRIAELPRLWLAEIPSSASWRRFRGRVNCHCSEEWHMRYMRWYICISMSNIWQ